MLSTATRLATAPVHAVLPVVDYARAKTFYTDVLGLEVTDLQMPGYGQVHAGDGTLILLYEREATLAEHTVAEFAVSDFDAVIAELRERGVVFEEYDMPGLKTEHGVAVMGDMKSAWLKDTEGNIIAISTP